MTSKTSATTPKTTRPKSKVGKSMDWDMVRAMSDDDVVARALTDPDNPPLGKAQLARMKRMAVVKKVRWALRMSQEEFAGAFRIPLGTLRDWEQHHAEPDQAARAYLSVIAHAPQGVLKALDADAEAVASCEN